MVRIICGRFGSGKTTKLLSLAAADIAEGRRVYMIVPEQETVRVEHMAARILPPDAPLLFETVNFSRLANSVFRRLGGLSYNYADNSSKALLMWRTLSELSGTLPSLGNAADEGRIRTELSAMAELCAAGVTPDMLSEAAQSPKTAENPSLSGILRDRSAVISRFETLLSEKYTDSAHDLDRAEKLLAEGAFFCGCTVYIDSFTSFTAQQYRIIRCIVRQAQSVTVSLCCGGVFDTAPQFYEVIDTAARLRRLAAKAGAELSVLSLPDYAPEKPSFLRAAADALWDYTASGLPAYDGSVKLLRCRDSYDEAEYTASEICALVREKGFMWSDIAVIARDMSAYDGLLDSVFDRYGIPYYMAAGGGLGSLPVVRLINSAFSVALFGFSPEHVISCLKTGLCGITDEECDIFESYIHTWALHGRAFAEETELTGNPSGYKESFSDSETELLRRINGIKNKFAAPYLAFADSIAGKKTVKELCCALYRLLCGLSVPEKMALDAKAGADDSSDEGRASVRLSAWDTVCSLLDSAVDCCGDFVTDTRSFAALFRMIMSDTRIGLIPPSADCVTAGSADMLRISSARAVFIIGASDGEFPGNPRRGGIFSQADRELLREAGIDLSGSPETDAAKEMFFFSRAAAAARERLYVCYPEADAAGNKKRAGSGAARLLSFLGKEKGDTPDVGLFRAQTARSALCVYSSLTQEERLALCAVLPRAEELYGECDPASYRLSAESISPELAEKLFGGDMAVTQSRIESFSRCPFSYYCNYRLLISEEKTPEFSAADFGNFTHAVLEYTIRELFSGEELPQKYDEATHGAVIDRAVKEYIDRICPDGLFASGRQAHLSLRLSRNLRLSVKSIISELAGSSFRPVFFELPVGGGDPASPEAQKIPTQSGSVSLYGIIDRADVCKKDGVIYIKAVDYKSSSKRFDETELSSGIGVQLPIYLMSLCRAKSPEYLRRLGYTEGDRIVPAGMLWCKMTPGIDEFHYEPGSAEAEAHAERGMQRTGVVLADDKVFEALGGECSVYLPMKPEKDGGYTATAGSRAYTAEDMENMFASMTAAVAKAADGMHSGSAKAAPFTDREGNTACKYCRMRPICRKSADDGSDTDNNADG